MNTETIRQAVLAHPVRSVGLLLAILALSLFSLSGTKPSESQRDNRRLMDAILTAIVIRNPNELSKDKELLKARHEAGKLSRDHFSVLSEVIGIAETGAWERAEEQMYQFRKQIPFPK